jgi:hypothetical protein
VSDVVRALAVEQRKRLVAALLSHCEQSPWWAQLSRPQQIALRERVLGSVGAYHDFLLDVLKVNRDGQIQNEYAVNLIRQVHEGQQRIERVLSDGG